MNTNEEDGAKHTKRDEEEEALRGIDSTSSKLVVEAKPAMAACSTDRAVVDVETFRWLPFDGAAAVYAVTATTAVVFVCLQTVETNRQSS